MAPTHLNLITNSVVGQHHLLVNVSSEVALANPLFLIARFFKELHLFNQMESMSTGIEICEYQHVGTHLITIHQDPRGTPL